MPKTIDEWKQLHADFHALWTRDAYTDGYDKEKWKRLEATVFFYAPPGFMAQ